jgi:hypothetical protein
MKNTNQFNTLDGTDVLSSADAVSNLLGTIEKDRRYYLSLLEAMFVGIFKYGGEDVKFCHDSYELFRLINAVMISKN